MLSVQIKENKHQVNSAGKGSDLKGFSRFARTFHLFTSIVKLESPQAWWSCSPLRCQTKTLRTISSQYCVYANFSQLNLPLQFSKRMQPKNLYCNSLKIHCRYRAISATFLKGVFDVFYWVYPCPSKGSIFGKIGLAGLRLISSMLCLSFILIAHGLFCQ